MEAEGVGESKTNGAWAWFEKWKKIFRPNQHELTWKGNWLENGYCKDCRYCCGPQDTTTPWPMAILPGQMRPNLEDDFYLLNFNTAYLAEKGCKSDTASGCRLSLAEKPVACGLFPLVLANGKIYLYQNCPAVLFTPPARFYGLALEAAKMLNNYELEDLRHISLDFDPETLADHFIDLHVRIFDENGKMNIME